MESYGLEIEFLGTGTSSGVPQIGCECEVCRSQDVRDQRMRTSAIVRYRGKNLLIDCGPDFRSQMLRASSVKLDALLITHIHYDHVGGMDDLRAYCKNGSFPVYARKDVIDDLHRSMPYCFADNPYPGVPAFNMIEVGDTPFEVQGIQVTPINVMHGSRIIVGYRIGPLAYITDAKQLLPETIASLHGIRVLVINALRIKEHHSHMNLDQALDVVRAINPEETYFIHMSHGIGLHEQISGRLPENVHFAFDGLLVSV